MSSPVLVVESLTHVVGGTTVLDDVSFAVEPGTLVVLSGRSGSGKTTLLHLLAGVSSPARGSITRLGSPVDGRPDWASVSLTPQHSAVSGGLTVRENILLPAALRGIDDDGGLVDALALDAIADRPATDTSLGEQQRTAIARGLVLRPPLALLDEPTSHQDDDNVARVLAVLLDARSAGTTLVVATHDERVTDVADQVVRLADGRVLPG
jgi:ABC-type multidrug transport system ATPase subunit